MPNEFYAVEFPGDSPYFFKDKDKAFEFLWQVFLNMYVLDYSEEELEQKKEDMYYWYQIDDFGAVHVCGFED